MTEKGIEKLLQERWPDCTYFARGGNSWVYKATISGKPIAVKVFRRFGDDLRYQRFLSEVETMKSLGNLEGIVKVNEIYCKSGSKPIPKEKIKSIADIACFTMEFYEGSLGNKLKEYSIDNGTHAVNTVLKIAKIIQRLHDKSYAHRDLKPDNVLIDSQNNSLLVSDYGLSIDLTNIPDEELRLTDEGELVGSLSYRAPELLRGRLDDSDHRPCDVYSLGRILWALINGKEPHRITDFQFQKSTVLNCGREIKNPAMLDSIIKGSTSVDPRYRTKIKDFIESLESWSMEKEKGSYDEAMEKLLNNPSALSQSEFWNRINELKQIHYETIQYLSLHFNELISEWRKMAIEFRSKKGFGQGGLQVNHAHTNYYPDFAPESLGYERFTDGGEPIGLEVRFQLGDIAIAPRIQLSIYIHFETQKWEGQKFLVFGGYIPKNSEVSGEPNSNSSIIVTESKTYSFDYRDAGIKDKMLAELIKGFEKLNKIFYETL